MKRPRLRFFLVAARTTPGLSPRLTPGGQSATGWKAALLNAGFGHGDEVVVTLYKGKAKR